ncbi:MAG: transposase [Amphiplicatus sp.]|nr:transposase [Amphiplicatus sp.]
MCCRVVDALCISERRACETLSQHRSTQRKKLHGWQGEKTLTRAVIAVAEQFGRCGYHGITALLRRDGWHANDNRVYRIWRHEGLKVPSRQPKRGRLWLNDGSCVRLRP